MILASTLSWIMAKPAVIGACGPASDRSAVEQRPTPEGGSGSCPEVFLWEVSYLRHRLPGHDTRLVVGSDSTPSFPSSSSMQTRAMPARLAQLPLRICCAKCLTLRHPKSCDSAAQKQKISGGPNQTVSGDRFGVGTKLTQALGKHP